MGSIVNFSGEAEDKRNQMLIRRLMDELLVSEEEIKRTYFEVFGSLRQGARITIYLPLLTWKRVNDVYHALRRRAA